MWPDRGRGGGLGKPVTVFHQRSSLDLCSGGILQLEAVPGQERAGDCTTFRQYHLGPPKPCSSTVIAALHFLVVVSVEASVEVFTSQSCFFESLVFLPGLFGLPLKSPVSFPRQNS